MKKNLEIEYKTAVSPEIYNKLMTKYNLKKRIYKQINHYFDSDDYSLINNNTTLRIRQKKDQYKLTKKVKTVNGTEETHVYLTKEDAINMLENGFDASLIGINSFVKKRGELTTYRAKTQYKNSMLFLDKSIYNKCTDYEVEIEVPDLHSKEIFLGFLKEENITFKKLSSKSYRCFKKNILESNNSL